MIKVVLKTATALVAISLIAFISLYPPSDTKAETDLPNPLLVSSSVVMPISGSVFDNRWSPDSSKIVYETLDNKIYIYDVTANTNTFLVDGHYPLWSHDGSSILFSGLDDNAGLFSINAVGGTPQQILDLLDFSPFSDITLTETEELGFEWQDRFGYYDVRLINHPPDGGLESTSMGFIYPICAVSPQGNGFIYAEELSTDGYDILGGDRYASYHVSMDGSTKTFLLPGTLFGRTEYFPNGDSIIIYFDRFYWVDTVYPGLWTVETDGTNLLQLVEPHLHEEEERGTWFRGFLNNTEFLYSSMLEIWSFDISGETSTKLLEPPGFARDICLATSTLAYRYGEQDDYQVYSIELDGSNNRLVFDGYGDVSYSPDGSHMLLTYDHQIEISGDLMDVDYYYLLDLARDLDTIETADSDTDGMPDIYEFDNSFDALDPSDALADRDDDGLNNYQEFYYETDLDVVDSDGDGLSDGVEVSVFQTDPTLTDTDSDGVSDGLEAAATGLSADIEVLAEGWIRFDLFWSDYTMEVETSSTVLGVTFDSDDLKLSIMVSGTDGTSGECTIVVPKALVDASSDISVNLDGDPIEFTVTEDVDDYIISVEYNHSTHTLVTNLSGITTIPVAAFNVNKTTCSIQEVITFTDQSTNNPTAWEWDFGDGTTSTVQNPIHAYSALGSYTVSLTATNADGSDEEVKTAYITVTASATGCGCSSAAASIDRIASGWGIVGLLGVAGVYLHRRKK